MDAGVFQCLPIVDVRISVRLREGPILCRPCSCRDYKISSFTTGEARNPRETRRRFKAAQCVSKFQELPLHLKGRTGQFGVRKTARLSQPSESSCFLAVEM